MACRQTSDETASNTAPITCGKHVITATNRILVTDTGGGAAAVPGPPVGRAARAGQGKAACHIRESGSTAKRSCGAAMPPPAAPLAPSLSSLHAHDSCGCRVQGCSGGATTSATTPSLVRTVGEKPSKGIITYFLKTGCCYSVASSLRYSLSYSHGDAFQHEHTHVELSHRLVRTQAITSSLQTGCRCSRLKRRSSRVERPGE